MQSTETRTIHIALAGNPNTGKTTLFNALCGTHQKTGNYPGVTVEKKTGYFREGGMQFAVVDLPGLYSLRPSAPDERISADILTGRQKDTVLPDLVLVVVDATNLERNLHLLAQLTEMQLPVAVALTMTDLLEEEGILLNIEALRNRLGLPLFEVNVRSAQSIDRLRRSLADLAQNAASFRAKPLSEGYLPAALEDLIAKANERRPAGVRALSRFELLNLIFFPSDTDAWLRSSNGLMSSPDFLSFVQETREQAKAAGAAAPSMLTQARYRAAAEIREGCEKRSAVKRLSRTDRIDRILTHKFFGLAAFIGVMAVVFQSIYTGAAPLMDLIDGAFGSLGDAVGSIGWLTPLMKSFLVDGIIAGVGSVIIFVPQIAILFALIAFLEDSGYLARASFLMDRLLGWTGLNGRSFIPLLSSFACAIPGIMAARVIADEKARKATILVAPLMSCSARLPVYILFIGAFIEPVYGTIAAVTALFAMHLLGIAVALPGAFILNRGILRTPQMPFIMEMPAYRLPVLRNVFFRVKEAVWNFTKRAGTIIFAFSVVIWALSYFPRNEKAADAHVEPLALQLQALNTAAHVDDPQKAVQLEIDKEMLITQMANDRAAFYLENSYLGRMGRAIQPLFAPLGFDWRLSVGIVSAFPAREVIIATLGIINNVGADADEESDDLRSSLLNSTDESGAALYTPLTAITLMVFFALCAQCMSTLAIIQKELGHWIYPVGVFVYMTGLAYALAYAVHEIGLWLIGT